MAALKERLRVALWFIERPRFYAEFIRYLRTRVRTLGLDRTGEARRAVAMCEEVHVTPQVAIERITKQTRFHPVAELYKAELELASHALETATVRMHGAGDLDLIFHLAEFIGATRAIETGVSAGWSSLAFLLSFRNRPGAKLVSTDMPYPGSSRAAQRYVGCVVPDDLRHMWQKIDLPDRESLPRALSVLPEIDICHYDSDKSYDGRVWAYRKLWKALRPGGLFISDDIDDNFGFFHFCGEIGERPIVVRVTATKGFKYIGIVTKPA